MGECLINTKLGPLAAIWEGDKLLELHIAVGEGLGPSKPEGFAGELQEELNKYFDGQLRRFEMPFELPEGPEFFRKIWLLAAEIPYGTITSYGELAREAGNPRAARAVGGAMRNNPILLYVPCHRVVAGNGSLGGFGGDVNCGKVIFKKKLLALEGIYFA